MVFLSVLGLLQKSYSNLLPINRVVIKLGANTHESTTYLSWVFLLRYCAGCHGYVRPLFEVRNVLFRDWRHRSQDNSGSFDRICFILFALQSDMMWLQDRLLSKIYDLYLFFSKDLHFYTFQHKKKMMSIQPRNTSVVYFVVKSFLIVMQKEWSRSDQNCPSYRGNGDATPCRGKKMTPNNGEPYPWQPAK